MRSSDSKKLLDPCKKPLNIYGAWSQDMILPLMGIEVVVSNIFIKSTLRFLYSVF